MPQTALTVWKIQTVTENWCKKSKSLHQKIKCPDFCSVSGEHQKHWLPQIPRCNEKSLFQKTIPYKHPLLSYSMAQVCNTLRAFMWKSWDNPNGIILWYYFFHSESFDVQVTTVLQRCCAHLRQPTKIRSFFSSADLEKVIHAFISARLVCWDALYSILSVGEASRDCRW